jgi:glutamyl-tRNA synthetase
MRTRFAPSPTGYLHIGGVRTALFNFLLARQSGGAFILRIDDTDQQRNVEAALQPILDGFRWLGITWDEGPEVGGPYGPYYQSQRQARYQEAVDQLLESGHAYRDFARPEELQSQREACEKSGRAFVYDRRWMACSSEQTERWMAEGRTAVVRLKMPREGECVFHDLIRGEVRTAWSNEQDHVIQRVDGTCLYHLASVVDDADFKITHVVRAVEHLSNTPRQLFIGQALGLPTPDFAHLPYVAEPGGTAKMSKRKLDKYCRQKDFQQLLLAGQAVAQRLGLPCDTDQFNPVLVDFYRQIGFIPDALLNYLLLLGWSLDDSREDFTLEEATELFRLERVNKSPAAFDPQKLLAFQTRWMERLSVPEKVDLVVPYLQGAGLISSAPDARDQPRLEKIVAAVGPRLRIAGDILDFEELLVTADQLAYDPALIQKRLVAPEPARPLLEAYRQLLTELEPFESATLEHGLKQLVEQHQRKVADLIHALRVAVTGKGVGCGMYEVLELLGRQESLARIDRALALASPPSESSTG